MGNAVEKIEQGTALVYTPTDMISKALDSGASVEVLERLLAMQERYLALQGKRAFDEAMAALRATLPTISKANSVDFTSQKGRTNYRYEDLATITEALSPIMAPLGLSFRWRTTSLPGQVAVTCIISHRDGHTEETELSGPVDTSGNKNPIQAIGSAVTYLQRYTLKAALGIAAAHDDDAQEVSNKATPRPAETPKADGRAIFDRLSKANRACRTLADYDALWEHPATIAAYDALPNGWKSDLARERADQFAEIEERARALAEVEAQSADAERSPFDE